MDDDGNRRSNRGSNHSNLLWVSVAILAVAAVIVAVVVNLPGATLPYNDLVALVENSKHATKGGPLAEGYSGAIEITKNGRTVRYSNIRDIMLGEQAIRGKLDKEVLAGPNVEYKKQEGITFRTHRADSEALTTSLNDLFTDQNLVWNWVPFLIVTSMIVLLFVVMMRRLGGAGSPMSFGRNRGRMYLQEEIGIGFDDVAGIDEAVEEIKEVVDFLRAPEKYQRLGGRIPKGVLLVGPPGTGKTLLAKAIAGEAGTPFFSLSGSDFVEMFVGVGAARVRDLFQQAEAKSPSIIFIDELDALGKTRGQSIVGGHDEREQTLNALLVEMDGFDSNSGVIVIAATNRPETLDSALLRAGRFDRQVLVDRPDISGREDILKVHVKNVKLDEKVTLRDIAAISPGFVGADLENLVNEAALLAARKGKASVGLEEFNEGVERVTAGLEKKKRVMNEAEKDRVAYHESGHALVAFVLPNTDPVHKVSIIPRGVAALGYTMQRPDGDRYLMTQSELESRIHVLMAGTLTEELIYGEISTGARNDLERATEIARGMVMEYGMSRLGRVNYRESNSSPFLASGGGYDDRSVHHSEQTAREIDEEVKHIIDESIRKVKHILETRKVALIALAKRLIEVESVDANELKRIIEENSPGPQVVPGTDGRGKQNVAPAADTQADEEVGTG